MTNRENAPSAAFACVLTVGELEFKLARHHDVDKVRDGLEHDTVDPALLAFALKTLDQIPVDDEEKENIRLHLLEHQNALAQLASEGSDPQPNDLDVKDVNRTSVEGDADKARKLVSQQAGGPDGNTNLQNPKVDIVMEPQESAVVNKDSGAVTAGATKPGVKDTDAGKPRGDHQDTKDVGPKGDVEVKTGKGTPAHPAKVSEGPVDSSKPTVHGDGGEVVETNDSPNDPADVPSSKGSTEQSKSGPRDALPEGSEPSKKTVKAKDGSTPTKKGKENGKPKAQDDGEKKVEPKGDVEKGKKKVNSADKPLGKNKPKGDSTYARVGDWVRNADGVVGVVTKVSESGIKVKIPRGNEGVSKSGWEVIVKANEVDDSDSVNLLKNEMRILNSPEALKLFATPTPEGQAGRNNKICFCSADRLTDSGKELIKDKLNLAMAGKAEAKVISVDKLGQTDLVMVRLGNDEEFPFTIAMEIHRDGEGKPEVIRLLSEFMPVEFMKDFAKFLGSLAKERSTK